MGFSSAMWFWGSIMMGLVGGTGSQPWSTLPAITGELCPNTCVWKDEPKYKNLSTTKGLCCQECSCDADCGLSNTCCFNELDTRDQLMKSLYSCTITTTRYISNKQSGFNMIVKNPRQGCINLLEDMDPLQECGDISVADWGSLHPVLSLTTGKIYSNDKCALCHNGTRIVYWEPVQVCKTNRHVLEILDATFVTKHSSNVDCYYAFELRGYDQFLNKYRCKQSPLDFCKYPNDFRITPNELNITKQEVIKACKSGFRSLFQGFVNVFCWMCSVKFSSPLTCDAWQTSRFTEGLHVLLDASKLDFLSNENKLTHIPRQVCKKDEKENKLDCVTVHCPTGQVRTPNQCEFIAKEWRHSEFIVFFILKPIEHQGSESISSETIETYIRKNQKSLLKVFLPSSMKSNWDLRTIYITDPLSNLTQSWSLIVVVTFKRNMTDPKYLIEHVQASLKPGLWKIKQRVNVIFTQTLAPFTNIQRTFPNSAGTVRLKFLAGRKGAMTSQLIPVVITKLFLCEQIELQSHLFQLSPSKDMLYYDGPKKHFYKNEFGLYQWNLDYSNMTSRICVSDSPYMYMSSSTCRQCSLLLALVSIYTCMKLSENLPY